MVTHWAIYNIYLQLAEIRAEHGVLARTEEVLKNRNDTLEALMVWPHNWNDTLVNSWFSL